jgi:hypothetical protein
LSYVYTKRWRDKRQAENPRFIASQNRLERYGLKQEEYDKMIKSCCGKCMVCDEQFRNDKRTPAVDHCHNSGRVRGLICIKCNTSLERFDNVPDFAGRVFKYLK